MSILKSALFSDYNLSMHIEKVKTQLFNKSESVQQLVYVTLKS